MYVETLIKLLAIVGIGISPILIKSVIIFDCLFFFLNFRDLRLVNWDCVLRTAISDIEVGNATFF